MHCLYLYTIANINDLLTSRGDYLVFSGQVRA